MLNTDGVSKSNQQLSMGFGLYLLTSLPLACSPSLGKYSEEALCTHSPCLTLPFGLETRSCEAVCISLLYALATPLM